MPRQPRPPITIPATVPQEAQRAILAQVQEWNGQLPASTIAGILSGDEACSAVWNYGPTRFAEFGALKAPAYRETAGMVEALVRDGLLRRDGGARTRLKLWLTAAGEAALKASAQEDGR